MEIQNKSSSSRVAFALLCGLAICASVMYITSDGEEYIHESAVGQSVESMDVLKSGDIISETPLGRMHFIDYFNSVEEEISDEVANRKADINSVRAQMGRDMAFNMASRAKLKRSMLHKMAINAKIARDHLNHNMRRCQERFAKQAHLANRRNRADLRRARRTKHFINHDKREAARSLKLAVSSWQKTTNAWAARTNARIDRLNAHAAANAAQIQENAKKARKDLDKTMGQWDHRVNTFRTASKNARSKLGEQFAAQTKATRAWANNQIKGLVASTAAQFNDVETKMAKNRQEVDLALRHATSRFTATLSAQKALEDKRFKQGESSIKRLKAETAAKVDAASSEYKVALLSLGSTVAQQVGKVNKRIDDASDVVRSDAATQAKINANVNAEMTRMVKLGNDRYAKHLKRNTELQGIVLKNKEATDKQLTDMATDFNSKLRDVRKQLKKQRKHAEDKLNKQTALVYQKLYADQNEQKKKNNKMEAETRRIRLDQMDSIRKAKRDFQKKITDLGKVVKKNDKKADKQIKKLTGVVTNEAAKSQKGRQALHDLEEANKKELKKSIEDAIAKGEKRAKLVEKRGATMDKETKILVNNKLNAEITKLRDETNASVEQLSLESKEARAQMKKEMLFAIRGAAALAKADLGMVVKASAKKMADFKKKASVAHFKSALERKALKEEILTNAKDVSRIIKDAVATDAKAQASLLQETAKAIKKSNTKVDAYAQQMKKNAKAARLSIKTTTTNVLGEIKQEQVRVYAALKTLGTADIKRQKSVLDFLTKEIKAAGKASDLKFGKAQERLANNRGRADKALSASMKQLNDALAAQAALEDARFKTSVKNLGEARKQATKAVEHMRKDFATQLALTTAEAKNVETRLADRISVVSGEVISMKALQNRVNRRVRKEKQRVEKLSNKRHSESKRARGKLRELIDANKALAFEETEALAKNLESQISKARRTNAQNKIAMAKDLTEATEKFYERLSDQQKADNNASMKLNGATEAAKLAAGASLKTAKDSFAARVVQLTDIVVANAGQAERQLTRLTGVSHDISKAAADDRQLIKDGVKIMEADLNKALTRAISIGEAKAKAVEQRLALHLKNTKQALQVELSESVERAADTVLKMVEGKRGKIADNYLSLKAYAITANDSVEDYVGKGQGKGLSSIGDLLSTVGALGAVRAVPREGMGMGGAKVSAIFSGEELKVSSAVSVVNGLVNEYTNACGQVRQRWPMGLGKYLLEKLQGSMYKKGVLQVGKVESASGSHVFINGHSIGLSNKLADLTKLAVRLNSYESTLAKLTAKMSVKKQSVNIQKAAYFVPLTAEWQGQ